MIHFKNEKDKNLFTSLHLALILVYSDLAIYAKAVHGINLVITETLTDAKEDASLNRVSDSHQKGIALDIRANDIPKRKVQDLCEYINLKKEYLIYHYQSFSGAKRLAYPHGEGDNFHIHLQIHQKYAEK